MRTRNPRTPVLAGASGAFAIAIALAVAACSGTPAGSAAGVTATRAPVATAAPSAAESPSAAASPASDRMEVNVVAAVRPRIDDLTTALKSGNKTASLAALEAYDAGWNGIEVYVNVRSKPMYDELEGHLQNAIEEGLAAPAPDFAALAGFSEQLATKYDEAIATAKSGAPLNPLFDDVTRLRMIRSDLRVVNAAIAAGDLAKARAHWATFDAGLPAAIDLIKVRSAGAADELTAAAAAARTAIADPAAIADTLKPLGLAVQARYNFGVGLWNAAARNADAAKTTYTQDDLANVAALNDVAIGLNHSKGAWQSGDFAAAAKAASDASAAFAEVQPKLAAHNGADATLKTAVEAWAKLAAAAGDAKAVEAAHRAAIEAIAVAQQVFVGQFWSDAALQAALAALPKS